MHVSKDPKYWDAINEKFYKKYYGIDRQHKVWADLVVRGENIVGPLGREWSIPIVRDYKGEMKIPWTTLTNYPVQGTGADVMMMVRIMFRKRLKQLGIPCKLVSTVHDSLVTDVAEEHVQAGRLTLFHQVLMIFLRPLRKYLGMTG